MLSPLTLASFESSLFPSSLSLGSYVGGRFLAFYPNRFVSSEGLHRQCEEEFLVGGVEKKPLVSGVEKNRSTLRLGNVNIKREDSIVSPTLSPYTSVDLGARSLVSGVDCNDPEKSPLLELLVIFFFTSS
jgi:hypothetical protein